MENISINIIASSSLGNCIVLNDNETFLILDFGVENLIWRNAKAHLNIADKKIAGILLSHYHIDHIQTIINIEVKHLFFYCSKNTAEFIMNKHKKQLHYLDLTPHLNNWVKVKDSKWKIKAIKTIHNAEGSLAFIIKNKKKQVVYITDTKYFYDKQFVNKSAYIIESPYGIEYDFKTKSKNNYHLNAEHNHLKLSEAEQLLKLYTTKKTKLFIFSHLNPTTKDFSIIDNVCKSYSTNKMRVVYINPNDVIKKQYFI